MLTGEVLPGDLFMGLVNGATFKVVSVDKDKDVIIYEKNGKRYSAGLKSFKRCRLIRIDNEN